MVRHPIAPHRQLYDLTESLASKQFSYLAFRESDPCEGKNLSLKFRV